MIAEMSGTAWTRRRRHRSRVGECGQGLLRIAGSPEETERIRLRWMLVDPVVMLTADRDQVLDCVLAALGASENVVRVDRSEASDLGNESLRSTPLITIHHLVTDRFRYAESLTFADRASQLPSKWR